MRRRRFLAISAACAASSLTSQAQATTWRGYGFGGEISLDLRAPRDIAEPALTQARQTLRKIEALFSLYDPNSALSQLNRDGQLTNPDPQFLDLVRQADDAYHQTHGLFDPTIQPLWRANATRQRPDLSLIGWDRIRISANQIDLAPGQQLTLNGIAQGFATDLVTEDLTAMGLDDILVNIGEFRGLGGPWRLGLQDPTHGHLGTRTLTSGAIATSSPQSSMILHPKAKAQWSTISVEATTATQADALSTALTLAPKHLAQSLTTRADIHRITLVDKDGNLSTLT